MKKTNYIIISCIILLILFIGGCCYYLCTNQEKDNSQEKRYHLIGEWIADGTQNKVLLEQKADGTLVYADDYSIAYQLQIKRDGTYYANFHNKNKEEEGTFQIMGEQIVFSPESNNSRPLWHCDIISDSMITNCLYAESFSKLK